MSRLSNQSSVKGQFTYRGFSIDEIHGRGSAVRNTYHDKFVILGSQKSGMYEGKHKNSISDFFENSSEEMHNGKYAVSPETYEYLKRFPKGSQGYPGAYTNYAPGGILKGGYHPGAKYLMADGPNHQGYFAPIGNFKTFRNRKHQMNKKTPL